MSQIDSTSPASSHVIHHAPVLLPPPVLNHGERQLPVYCPQCGSRIEIRKGLCGNRLIDAIMLQTERIGTELECQRCQTRFVFQKLETLPRPQHEQKQLAAMAHGRGR